ncbi:3,4-dihydroxy-2-butanone 4-phosphate synthase [Protomyces lactucae-debilis]|uniref:3,4-dihydroxy-2-butanone 4-phosphate synthase n=1 Tax=Protomyces lactucae-debilis TaxID=2754530 RepID=A0A1Y2FUR7_PROLT|nr:3,4-dihydroxy-2-butanone 4-phosphate synthase [Protomyces lactucae-debilis]ORY87753.1 3,4-dihydroxy-2-butanone 4-phosphate synthase [Protomyces lactucae-debilis]
MPISDIPTALEAFKRGEFLIVIDNPSRENEGDLIISAAHLTPSKMAFMIRYTSGLICVPMSAERLLELGLPDMVERNEESLRTAYTISCDARQGVTTGISAGDRARTCNLLAGKDTAAADLVRPGHIFPLRAREGGVLTRDGHTEAAVDLCRLTGLTECAAISEIIRDADGEMARTDELLTRGQNWGIQVITIEDLKQYRLDNKI